MFRNASAYLLTAALALTASAAPKEIPPKLVAHEATARARLTPAESAKLKAIEPRLTSKTSVADVKALAGGGATDGLLLVLLMDVMKDALKNLHDDRKFADNARRLAVAAKTGKLDAEKAKIDAERREAEERFDHAMDAANKEMAIGIASMAAAAASAAGGFASSSPATSKAPVNARLAVTPPVVRVVPVPTRTPTKVPVAGK